MIWSFAWWPHALRSGSDLFYTSQLWAPEGFNVTWMTSVPGLALLFSPIIWFGGPILAFNLAGLLAPAVNAFPAYLVCRLVTRTTWLAAIGGYVYGFSPYVVGHLIAAHANLFFIPWPALTVYVCALFALDRIGNVACIMLLTLAGLFQFLTSIEVFATTMVAGTIALAIFGLSASFEFRRRWLALAKNCAIAALAVATLVSPFVYRFLAQPEYVSMPVVLRFVGSPGALLIPSSNLFISHHRWTVLLSSRHQSALPHAQFFEHAFYLGPLLLVIVWAAALRDRSAPNLKWLIWIGLLMWVLSLGQYLQSRGSVYSDALVDIRQASSHQDGYSGSARSVFVFGFGRDYCDDMRGVPRAKAWNSPGDIDRTGSASRFSLYRYFGTEPARSRVFPIFSSQRAYISGRDCSCTAGWRQQRCYGLASRDRYVFQPALCLYLLVHLMSFAEDELTRVFGKDGKSPAAGAALRSSLDRHKVTKALLPTSELADLAKLSDAFGSKPVESGGVFIWDLQDGR